MNIKELKEHLSQFPADTPIKLQSDTRSIIDFTPENILHTSETAYVDGGADEDEWDDEDGKIELGDGQQYLLFNPIIL